jgi:hypothetical protein
VDFIGFSQSPKCYFIGQKDTQNRRNRENDEVLLSDLRKLEKTIRLNEDVMKRLTMIRDIPHAVKILSKASRH